MSESKKNKNILKVKGNSKRIAATLVLGTLAIAGTIGAGSAFADESNKESLTQKIAARFSLSEDEVNSFFEEEKATRQAESAQKQEDKLTQLVTDGKITEDQKALLISKQEEMRTSMEENKGNQKADREEMKNMTKEEREADRESKKAEMEASRAEMESWLETNGIDKELLPTLGMGGGHKGGHRGQGGVK